MGAQATESFQAAVGVAAALVEVCGVPAIPWLAQLPGSPPLARTTERRNRVSDDLIRAELREGMRKIVAKHAALVM